MVEKNAISSAVDKLRSVPWHNLFYMFYIEPIIIMLIFSHMLSGVVMRNQIIYQTCKVIFHYNESDCSHLDDKNASSEIHAIETEMQSYVADMFLTRTLMESIVPAVCGLFIGAWSDRYGRKPLLVISMIGFAGSALITAIICALSSYHDINPWWYTLAAVPHSLLGGMCVFSVAAYCFISDITDIRTRPYRMIAIEALMFIALSSGSLLSSYVYEATSAAITQGISAAILVVATLFSIFYFPESLHISLAKEKAENAEKDEKDLPNIVCDTQVNAVFSKETKRANEKDEKDPEPKLVSELDDKNGLKANENKKESSTNELCTTEKKLDDKKEPKPMETLPSTEKAEMNSDSEEHNVGLFSITHIKDMIKTSCKPREHHTREIIWLVTLAMFINIFIIDGATTVMYLFVRQKFHWSVREFTFFETIAQVVSMLGALIGFLMLRKVFGLSVVTLALFAFGSDVLSNLTKGFATLSWHMYLSIAFSIFRSIGQPMCHTIVSNIIPASDLGKIFSIKNVLQSFAPFVAAPVYTLIYQHSLSVWPGLFNLVSAALFLVSFIAIGFVWRYKFVHKEHYAKLLK